MACCHNVMLLLDTAGGAAGRSPVRRAALRLLLYLSCRFGLARVRWAFRFFDSQGARGRPSRVSDFRELGARSWEDFEEELEARLGDGAAGAHLPGPAPRAAHTHGALMETLLDYQWDRPEITSPTKPALRRRGRRLLDAESEAAEAGAARGGFGNAVFLLGPCPRSQRELVQFVSGCEAQAQGPPPTPKQVMEKLLPRRVQEVMVTRKVTLYWVDTTERSKLWESPDHLGYWTVCELLQHLGGTVLPLETLSPDGTKAGETLFSREPHLSSWVSALPTDSILNCVLYNSPEYEASFPRTEGTLFLPVEGKETQEAWTVILEPLAMHQRHFQKPVRIFLKGTATQWSLPTSGTLGTDSWMLQSPEENKSAHGTLFQQLVHRLTAEELHLVASVDPGDGWPPVTGVISPLSTNTTVLTVFRTEEAAFQRHFLQTAVAENPLDTASLCSDVMGVILSPTSGLLGDPTTSAPPCPEWAQQELGRTAPWRAAVAESWFPCSNLSGASSNLMESFWLLQAASPTKEESSKTESELTRRLAELYLRRSREEPAVANQEDSRKKRGVPRTPVRQKMKTMCRSLKMLNVARLNVKAQKLHPDGSPEATGDRGTQQTAGGRTAGRLEHRGKTRRSAKPKDFKTEEELQSYIHENYQKTMATGETVLYSCAQSMISTIKAFLKSKGTKDLEMSCLHQVKSNLLKTSKSLRQDMGENRDKEDKIRECQLQVFLRLEMCVQCPSIRDSIDDVEQLVEEVADLLRMVCLTEDSAYLATFLEEILALYIDSIPKTLGQLYDSLGIVVPQKLAEVLPTDFFSDDSVTQESKSPLSSGPLMASGGRSAPGGTDSDRLEELRTRSAKKRRKNALIRHKSIAEVSQNRRQIEIPKVSQRSARNENSRPTLPQPSLPVKDPVQEVTKVRRNLFTQEISPSKRPAKRGLPRSHSVSAVEGLQRKLDSVGRTRGHPRLLTRTVAETPEHKQVSGRLLHRQIKGRSSDPGPEIDVVEESPEKEVSLRRSPRIKQLALGRTKSGPFYSASQPQPRSVQRVHSSQQSQSDQRGSPPIPRIRSPKTLLFGAVSEVVRPSEEGAARRTGPSGDTLASEMPTAYQTPKKSSWKPPCSPRATPPHARRPPHAPRTPQTPLCSPQRRQKPCAARTPARQGLFQSPKDSAPHGRHSASLLGRPLPEGGASPLGTSPRTPRRPGGQPLRLLQSPPWLPSVASSPESTPHPAAWGAPREAACVATPPTQKPQHPHHLGASWGEEPAQRGRVNPGQTPTRPGDIAEPASPLASPLASPAGGFPESPPRTASAESPHPGQLDAREPPRTSGRAKPDASHSPLPAPEGGTRLGNTSSPERGSLEGQPRPCTAPAHGTDTRRQQQEGGPSPPSEGHGDPGPGCRTGWHTSSPVLAASDTEPLPVPGEAEDGNSHSAPLGDGEGLRPAVAGEQPSDPGTPPPAPRSPRTPPGALRCAAPLERLPVSAQLSEAPAHPQAYEVELDVQAGGLPRLQIKKVDTSPGPDAEPLRREPSVPPGLAVPRGSKASRPDTYTSPPCLRPAHSSPGKNGGQTYICQSCTPTRCHSSTPSPFQADTGVPWTPSPKHSGKTTPDTIKDWPRRKRAVDGSLGTPVGRADAGTDLGAGGSLLRPEGTELDLELGLHKTRILGDFELEGVCQLPDQSPPGAGDGVPASEDAYPWGPSGRGPRKRLLSAEDAECEAKRACGQRREDPEPRGEARSPGPDLQQLPSAGDDEPWVSGSTPPPGRAVRSGLSARGLQALTQSPLLFHGKTLASQGKDAPDEDSDVFPATEDSPFSRAFSRTRPVSRTYSRKKLIS
ncbi:treslin [Myotis myotis]|uniref:TOPBP1 interacting checkpoint and replication regulator n=1 Tax=Myotis myotis TaxID=51298 RepID=A0A7J7RSY3_MYOMY|nr:treslin [Myotis myotis]KAF6279004.1 TOPBP1 interacting checkpoint and replication regulator [Myotis myotis]